MTNSKKIILVGNGTCITDKKNGELVESFDTVVRFNNYAIEGFEDYVGKRTDVWVTRICDTIRHRDREEFGEIIGVMNYCKWTQAIKAVVPKWVAKYPDIKLIKPEVVKTYAELPDFVYNPMMNWLSVGLITIKTFLDLGYDQLHLLGFGGDPDNHYHNIKPQGQEHHRFDLEANHIKKLEEEGKVVRI